MALLAPILTKKGSIQPFYGPDGVYLIAISFLVYTVVSLPNDTLYDSFSMYHSSAQNDIAWPGPKLSLAANSLHTNARFRDMQSHKDMEMIIYNIQRVNIVIAESLRYCRAD